MVQDDKSVFARYYKIKEYSSGIFFHVHRDKQVLKEMCMGF
jgi:hypothetical protein